MGPKTLKPWLAQTFRQNARRKALTFLREGCMETTLTYAQLHREVANFADELKKHGVSHGERVIMFLQKSVDAVIAHLAVQRLGAVSVHLNPGFKASEMDYLLRDAKARLVLCDPGRADWISGIDAAANTLELPTHRPYVLKAQQNGLLSEDGGMGPALQDPGLVIYTSGTTGDPKGAILTQQNLTHDAANIIDIWEITSNDVLCHALPLFHIHGLCFAMHTALLSGAHIMMMDHFDPEKVVNLLSQKEGDAVCTIFMAVPAMYAKLADWIETREVQKDFSHIRLLTSGSAPLLPSEFERIARVFGQEPVEREGMSETGMNFSNPLGEKRVPGSVGLPLPGLQVRLVDPYVLQDVGDGQIGEIWLKGKSITPGYWQKPTETQKSFIDGWFRTGDLGKKDQAGYYYLTDRIKHIIISGGENISAKEIELAINRMDGVLESSVVGLADPQWGERVVAAVVSRPGVDLKEEEIISYCKTHLHDWKCPKEIKFLGALPRNTMGKVLKDQVKRIFIT